MFNSNYYVQNWYYLAQLFVVDLHLKHYHLVIYGWGDYVCSLSIAVLDPYYDRLMLVKVALLEIPLPFGGIEGIGSI